MSRWLILIGLVSGFFLANMAGVWFFTRERPIPEQVKGLMPAEQVASSPRRGHVASQPWAGRVPSPPPAAVAMPIQQPPPTPNAPESAERQALGVPPVDSNTPLRLDSAQLAWLSRPARMASSEPADQADRSASGIHMAASPEELAPGREADAVAEAGASAQETTTFIRLGPGQATGTVDSRGSRASAAARVSQPEASRPGTAVADAGNQQGGVPRGRGRRFTGDEGKAWR